MLTYKTGTAASPSGALSMADHLLELTVPPEQAALAVYYNGVPQAQLETVCAAEIGHDHDPSVLKSLALTPRCSVGRDEIARLLCGLRADGGAIEGKQIQCGMQSVAEILDLPPGTSLLDSATLERIASFITADTDTLSPEAIERRNAASRLLRLYDVPAGHPIDDALCRYLARGIDFNGKPVDRSRFLNSMTASKSRVAYIDLTWSADKSVSVAWAFAGTDAERAMILQAHRDAVDEVMKQVENELGRARKGKAGRLGSEQGLIGWLRFDHFTARPTVELPDTDLTSGETFTRRLPVQANGDPQLHTHVIVPNFVLTETGRVGGLDLRRLSGRVKELGALYQSFLARNLRLIGVEVALDRATGAARLPVVSDAVRDAFSKRTVDGTHAARVYARAQGIEWDQLDASRRVALIKQSVQGDPRSAKQDDMSDFTAWRSQAVEIGWDVPIFVRPNEIAPVPDREERLDTAFRVTCELLDALFQGSAVLDASTARICAARSLIHAGIENARDIDTVVSMLAERQISYGGIDTDVIWIEDIDDRGEKRTRLTTRLHIERETELVALAQEAASDRSGALPVPAIDMGITRCGLDFGGPHGEAQYRAMISLGTGGKLSVLIGVAGSGKTTLLAPLVQGWKEDGRTVWGTAVAWRQAQDLAGAGIEPERLRATFPLLKQFEAGQITLDRNAVVVLDELSLLSSEQLLGLLRAQKSAGFQLALIGDPLQCGSVEAGPVMDLLRRALGEESVPELLSSVRQQTERERSTALMLRDGRTREALQRKLDDETLILAPGSQRDVVEHIADLWLTRYEAGRSQSGFTLTVSAPTNADARAVAQAIRERRRRIGEIGADGVRIAAVDQHGTEYEMVLAVGDRVRLYARTNAQRDDGKRGIIGNNGSVLTVTSLSAAGVHLRNKQDHEGFVAWTTLKDPQTERIRLGYGDVLSIDAAQGLTSVEHIEAMPQGSRAVDAHRAYVQGSRHRMKTWLVTSEGAERREIAGRRPLGDVRAIRGADILDNMARNMARRDPRLSALALLDRAREIHRQTLHGFQSACLAVERHRQETARPISLAPSVAQYRQRQAVELAPELMKNLSAATRVPVSALETKNDGPTPTTLVELLAQAIRQALALFGTRLIEHIQRRRLRRNLTTEATRLWRRVERSLTPEERPAWGTDAYFTTEAKQEMFTYRSISMDRAADLHRREMRRRQDARRLYPCGVETASERVERLFVLTAYQKSDGSNRERDTLAIPWPARAQAGPHGVFDNLARDLAEMGVIWSTHSAGGSFRQMILTRKSLVSAFTLFDFNTVTSVCNRLLLAKSMIPSVIGESSADLRVDRGLRRQSKPKALNKNNTILE